MSRKWVSCMDAHGQHNACRAGASKTCILCPPARSRCRNVFARWWRDQSDSSDLAPTTPPDLIPEPPANRHHDWVINMYIYIYTYMYVCIIPAWPANQHHHSVLNINMHIYIYIYITFARFRNHYIHICIYTYMTFAPPANRHHGSVVAILYIYIYIYI